MTLGRLDGAHHRQAMDAREGEVALVLGRHRHDGPRAVGAEHVVGHVDRDGLAGEGVGDETAGEGAALLQAGAGVGGRGALELAGLTGALHETLDRGALVVGDQIAQHRMLGGDHRVGDAETGVGSRGEDAQDVTGVDRQGQVELDTLAAPDPVTLHGLHPFGPLEGVDVIEEFFGVVGDLEEPLLEVSPLHQVARAVTGTVGVDLFIRQHRMTAGAPVDRCLSAIGQTGLEERQEDRLCPLDVGGVVRVDLATPVEDGAEAHHRGLELGHSLFGEQARVRARLDGRVLRRQPERVESEGREHRLAVHGLVANHQVTEGVVTDMALVRRPGGVGVHAQGVETLTIVVVVDFVGPLAEPPGLPLLLNCTDVKGAGHLSSLEKVPAWPDRHPEHPHGHEQRQFDPRPPTRHLGAVHTAVDTAVAPRNSGAMNMKLAMNA